MLGQRDSEVRGKILCRYGTRRKAGLVLVLSMKFTGTGRKLFRRQSRLDMDANHKESCYNETKFQNKCPPEGTEMEKRAMKEEFKGEDSCLAVK